MFFNEKLKVLRKEKGCTQKDLAIYLNCSNNKYASWEQGRTEPDIESIILLADFFEVSIDELFGRKNIDNTIIIKNQLNEKEKNLINDFREMNQIAQNKIIGYVQGLKETPYLTRHI